MSVETFGEKTAWLAFKTSDFNRVRVLLFGPDGGCEVAWDDRESYEWTEVNTANVFVTPPIVPKRRRGGSRDTFVLATGVGLLRWWIHGHSYAEYSGLACPPVLHNELVTRAAAWSREWQLEIQCFANQRNIGLYGWAQVRPDATMCRFSELDSDVLESEGEVTSAGTAVDDVAARWSVYPDTLERLPAHGWLGALRL